MSRYPPPHDQRYPPRERSRSPPRFNDRRPSGAFNSPFPPRNPPLGPRGRGAPFYNDLADTIRGPLPTGARPFRDRDFDRRGRPPSPPLPPLRTRSPPRNFRDAPAPRELDVRNARRNSRDGPFSAGASFNEPAPFNPPPPSSFPRGGFAPGRGRGRGRGDFDFRDRGRRPPFEDRGAFRPRDRSPPARWGRDDSRESREEWRTDRQDDERWPERDTRDRDPAWFRRDSTGPRFEPRPEPPTSSRPATPHQPALPSQNSVSERSSIDISREGNDSRRSSTGVFAPQLSKDPRQDAAAAQNSRGSPPPQAPSVPAFGSVSFKPASYNGPTSNVWRPGQDVRQPPSPAMQSQRAPSPVPKSAPTGPRAQAPPVPSVQPPSAPSGSKPPPEAPKAPRALEPPPVPGFKDVSPVGRPSNAPPQIPTGPAAFRTEERPPMPSSGPSNREWQTPAPAPPSAPASKPQASIWSTSPVQRPVRDPSGEPMQAPPLSVNDRRQPPPPSPTASEARYSRNEAPPSKLETPPPTAPSGPRAHTLSTSPQMSAPGIPTAPKADRAPPTGPRAAGSVRPPPNAPRGPAWNQWRAPGFRETVVPAKRDSTGEEKEQSGRLFSASSQSSDQQSQVAKDESLPPPAIPAEHEMSHTRSSFGDDMMRKPEIELSQRPSIEDSDVKDRANVMDSDDSSSDDDGMDLDDDDVETTKLKFEQEKARLQAQLVDLSERQYRATTPLEQLARLAKITVNDLPGADEMSSTADAQEIEEEEDITPRGSPVPEDIDQDLLTPKMEEQEMEQVVQQNAEQDIEQKPEHIVPDRSSVLDHILPPPRRNQSPPPINLPYLFKEPVSPHDSPQEHLNRQANTKAAMMAHLANRNETASEEEHTATDNYAERYRAFKRVAQSFDDQRLEKERLERQKSADTGPDLDANMYAAETPISENSRRLHKFSSEYDIQKVLKESEETARIEQERLEREAEKARYALEKEAVQPEMFDEETRLRRLYKNTNNFRNAWHVIDVYAYQPPADDFTDEEHRIFLEAFKERPKKWGEIASKLPGRTYQNCIHHYYAHKWDGRFRETKGRRKRGIGKGRGGKLHAKSRGAALMADLGPRQDDVATANAVPEPVASTSGRPRRAAASRTTTNQVAELETKSSNGTPARKGPKAAADGEPGTEKPVKRRKAAKDGEKVSKRSKPQPVATPTVGSPVKTERDTQFKPNEMSREELARVQEATLLADLHSGNRAPPLGTVPVYHTQSFLPQQQPPAPAVTAPPPPPASQAVPMVTAESAERPKLSAQVSQSRAAASSYWSVPEQQDFVKFLGYYGTDFAAIAQQMGTKTHTMIKNHYQRSTDNGNRPELVQIAEGANAARSRGEDMGAPPTPTPIVKRRYDNPPTAVSRSLVSHGDLLEAEDPITAAAQALISRFPPPAASTPAIPRAAPTPLQAALATTSQKPQPPAAARVSQPPGPKMGYFTESRPEARSSISFGGSRQMSQTPLPAAQEQQQVRQQREPSDAGSAWYKNLLQEQERAITLQKDQEQRLSQERVPTLGQHHSSLYPNLGPQAPRSLEMPRRQSGEERAPTPSGLAQMTRPGLSAFRPMLGSPQPSASATPVLNAPQHPGPSASPPKNIGFRPSTVPAPSPAPTAAKLSAPSEPRKTSNLASLLNSEPEDPRPKKRVSDQTAPLLTRPQSPAVHTRNPTPTGIPPIYGQPRGDTAGQASAPPRSIYDRPVQSTAAPTPPLPKHEPATWSTVAASRREEWPSRQPVTQPPPQSSSPNPMQLERDRSFFPHRSALSALSGPPRGGPSPPPPHGHGYMGHSRTSSFSHGTPPQQHPAVNAPPSQMPPRGEPLSNKAGSVLQPNPYAQPPGPAAHVQQMQAQQQQQNQMHHMYNQGMHSRHGSRDDEIAREHQAREHHAREQQERAYRMDPQRYEYERAREREAQAAAYHAEQARYAQHRPPPQALHAPMQQGPPDYHQPPEQGARMSLREQAQREGMAGYREAQLRLDRERADHEMMMRRNEQEEMNNRRRMDEEMRSGMAYPRSASGMGMGGYGGPPPRRR